MLNYFVEKKCFKFKQASGTSRGILTEKHAWFVKLWFESEEKIVGLGEASIIPGLSPDFTSFSEYEVNLENILHQFTEIFHNIDLLKNTTELNEFFLSVEKFPSILFAIETAALDLINGGKGHLFDSDFTLRSKKIPINGLIWMGTTDFIQQQIEEKLAQGFTCLKMKVGALNFEEEIEILASIRKRFPKEKLILRVDANGAFGENDVVEKLNQLARLDIHSIEQPIKQGNWNLMKSLCKRSILPIALDEELIGITSNEAKKELLNEIMPQFIILKPSLHGGLIGSREWIKISESLGIKWWITSALESNVGLNAICQFTSTFENLLHQGLGTGSLYVENTPSRLKVENGYIFLD
jgi:L-alanine-DL-glutamate epimerase-like enolase superfamily enzyme